MSSKRTYQDFSIEQWTKRSTQLGQSLNGVLFKGLPDVLNRHIHQIHMEWIRLNLNVINESKIFDVGCGYGRISMDLLENGMTPQLIGMDFVENYAHMYCEHIKMPAFVGSITDIPVKPNYFDAVVCVTVLMYLEDRDVDRALDQLITCLRPGGTLLLIEPDKSGKPFQTAFGIRNLFSRRSSKQEFDTGGRWFSTKILREKIQQRGGNIVRDATIPLSTILFLPLYVVAKVLPINVTQAILNIAKRIDRIGYDLPTPTLYKMYTIYRKS